MPNTSEIRSLNTRWSGLAIRSEEARGKGDFGTSEHLLYTARALQAVVDLMQTAVDASTPPNLVQHHLLEN